MPPCKKFFGVIKGSKEVDMSTPSRVVVTKDLNLRANKNIIEGKRYPREIEEAAARRPRLTPEEINRAWAKVHGK